MAPTLHPLDRNPHPGHARRSARFTLATLLTAGVAAAVATLASAAALAQPVPDAPGRHDGLHRGMPQDTPHRAMPGDGPGHAHRAMVVQRGGHPGIAAVLPERLLDRVGASAEQKAQVRSIAAAARQDLREQHDAVRQLHQQMDSAMASVMAAPQVDGAAAEGLRQKLVAQHDLNSKRLLQARLDALAVLTAEQRQKLAEHMAQSRQMHQRHRQEREALHGPHS